MKCSSPRGRRANLCAKADFSGGSETMTPEQVAKAAQRAERLTDKTVPKQLTPFKPGKSGNPKGRPKGARSKLGEAFLEALFDDFNANGVFAIMQVRQDRPDQYLKVIASVLPKEITGEDGGPVPVKVTLTFD